MIDSLNPCLLSISETMRAGVSKHMEAKGRKRSLIAFLCRCWSLNPALDLYFGKATTSRGSSCRFTLITHQKLCFLSRFKVMFLFLSPNVSVLRVSGSFNPPTHFADGSIHRSQKQQSAALGSQDVCSSICLDLTPIKGGAE